MSHDTKVMEIKELSDSQVAYRVRCCDEETTDSWHTVSVMNPDIDKSLEAHKERVSALHEAKVQWRDRIKSNA